MPLSRNCTPHCHFCTMQKALVKFTRVVWSPVGEVQVGCWEPSTDTSAITRHTKGAASDISNVFTKSLLLFTKSKHSLQNCSQKTWSHSLSSWMIMQILLQNLANGAFL